MNITNENGIISEIEYDGIRVPFGKGLGPSFYVKKELLQEKVELHTEKCVCGGENTSAHLTESNFRFHTPTAGII